MKNKMYTTLLGALMVAMSALGTAALAADNGVSDTEIRIGQFAAQTGPAAELGKRMQAGIKAQFAAVNAAGGINGRKLSLVSRDDSYEPEKSALAVKALIEEDKVFALIGSVGTPTTLAAIPAINAAGIPLIGPVTGAQALREPFNRNLFHVRASFYDETEKLVQHLSTLGIKKVAIFYQNDSYGKAGLEGVMRALTKRNMKPVASVTVERNSVDVGLALAEILKTQPEAVIQISAYKSCAALIRQAREKSFGGMFLNVSFVGSTELANELGDTGVGVKISQVVPFPFAPTSAIVREYQQRMTEAGEKTFGFGSMEGFLAARVLTEGLRKAGKGLSRDALVSALQSMRNHDMNGFFINYSGKDHDGSNYTDLTFIGKGGRFIR